jgi:hypothetical protein
MLHGMLTLLRGLCMRSKLSQLRRASTLIHQRLASTSKSVRVRVRS